MTSFQLIAHIICCLTGLSLVFFNDSTKEMRANCVFGTGFWKVAKKPLGAKASVFIGQSLKQKKYIEELYE